MITSCIYVTFIFNTAAVFLFPDDEEAASIMWLFTFCAPQTWLMK